MYWDCWVGAISDNSPDLLPNPITYRWLSGKLQYLQCVSKRDTAVLYKANDVIPKLALTGQHSCYLRFVISVVSDIYICIYWKHIMWNINRFCVKTMTSDVFITTIYHYFTQRYPFAYLKGRHSVTGEEDVEFSYKKGNRKNVGASQTPSIYL